MCWKLPGTWLLLLLLLHTGSGALDARCFLAAASAFEAGAGAAGIWTQGCSSSCLAVGRSAGSFLRACS